MTVQTTTSRIAYTGNAATTSFSFPYPFFNATDINVYVNGVLKTLTTDYTVSGSAPYPSGANIVFTAAPANLASIVLIRVVPYTQELDLVENDPFPADSVEEVLDANVLMSQQLLEQLGRAFVIPATDVTGTNVTLPAAASRANQTLGFDSAGNIAVGAIATAVVSAAMQPVVGAATLALARTAMNVQVAGSYQPAGNYAASGANADITSLSALTNIGSGQLAGFRNFVINGDFKIWQRATTAALVNSASYSSADRWAIFQATSAAATVSQSTSVPSNAGFKYSMKAGRNNGSALTNQITLGQPMETLHSLPLASKQVTLSFYAKAGANYSPTSGILNALLITGTGTDESINSMLSGGWTGYSSTIQITPTLTTSWQRFSVTATVAAGVTQAGVEFTMQPIGTAGADDNFYLTGVQVEINPVASAYEFRPFQLELFLCQRFYEKSFAYGTAPVQNNGANSGEQQYIAGKAATGAEYGNVRFMNTKRASPSITLYNTQAANAQIRDLIVPGDCSGSSTVTIGDSSFSVICAGNASTTAGNVLSYNWTASAEF